jgi:phospho-N-acetylmuramoyl-pentapeptide-transferase
VLVLVGSSNAVNLTDGLDGLAGGCLVFAVGAMTVVTYASGHAQWAAYLQLPRIAGAGEMTVLAGAMIGGLLGFLWFNCPPAQVFMGDTGSLAIGGSFATVAILLKSEFLLVIIGGVFVAEAASVMIQVGTYKYNRRTRGREYADGHRFFRMAPLHHHFEKLGWAESTVVVRFWILGIFCALIALATLKLR